MVFDVVVTPVKVWPEQVRPEWADSLSPDDGSEGCELHLVKRSGVTPEAMDASLKKLSCTATYFDSTSGHATVEFDQGRLTEVYARAL